MTAVDFARGGYRFIPSVFQYSAGVAAISGFRIERVRFKKPVPMADGFRRIEQFIREAGRPLASFCACELRSPRPFSEADFRTFNETYVGELARWDLIAERVNPVARSNVCPELSPPAEACFHAFCFAAEWPEPALSFVISGSGEAPEGKTNYRDHVVRLGDCSPAGLREKARFVLGQMEARLAALDVRWQDTSATQVYTVHDLYPFIAEEIVKRGAAEHGLTWHFNRPPVANLEYEMDCRCVHLERVIEG